MAEADGGLHAAAAGDALTRAGHAAVEVHAVDTDGGVVLDAEIDVLADTEAEVAGLGEVALAELVLLDLEATLEDLLSLCRCQRQVLSKVPEIGAIYLGATDGDVDSDLLVTADTEGTDGVTGLAFSCVLARRTPHQFSGGMGKRTVDRSLTRQLLEHLGGTSEPVTGFTDRDVQNELLNLELPHGVASLLGRHCCGVSRRALGLNLSVIAS